MKFDSNAENTANVKSSENDNKEIEYSPCLGKNFPKKTRCLKKEKGGNEDMLKYIHKCNEEYSIMSISSQHIDSITPLSLEAYASEDKLLEYKIHCLDDNGKNLKECKFEEKPILTHRLFDSMVSLFAFLERKKIVHRGIEESIFNFYKNENQLKINDFSKARMYDSFSEKFEEIKHTDSIYDPPEIVWSKGMKNKNPLMASSYSFSITWLIMAGALSKNEYNEAKIWKKEKLSNQKLIDKANDVHFEDDSEQIQMIQALLKQCLKYNPMKRPSFIEMERFLNIKSIDNLEKSNFNGFFKKKKKYIRCLDYLKDLCENSLATNLHSRDLLEIIHDIVHGKAFKIFKKNGIIFPFNTSKYAIEEQSKMIEEIIKSQIRENEKMKTELKILQNKIYFLEGTKDYLQNKSNKFSEEQYMDNQKVQIILSDKDSEDELEIFPIIPKLLKNTEIKSSNLSSNSKNEYELYLEKCKLCEESSITNPYLKDILTKSKDLNLPDYDLSDKNALVAKILKVDKNIRELTFTYYNFYDLEYYGKTKGIGDEGILNLKTYIPKENNLKTLNISAGKTRKNQFTTKALENLNSIFENLKFLENLDISYNQIEPNGVGNLRTGLKNLKKLKKLNMEGTNIECLGLMYLKEALDDCNFTHLNLSNINLVAQVAITGHDPRRNVFDILKNSNMLVTLNISNNKLEKFQIIEIIKALTDPAKQFISFEKIIYHNNHCKENEYEEINLEVKNRLGQQKTKFKF